jgi:hypothetical protein
MEETESWNGDVYVPQAKYYEYLLKIGIQDKIEPRGGSKFIFKCPECRDHKKRGYLLTSDDGRATIGCLRGSCQLHSSWGSYLKSYHPMVHKEWVQDIYVGVRFHDVDISHLEEELNAIPDNAEEVEYELFLPIKEKRDSSVRKLAINFIKDRMIPKHLAKHFYYCEEGRYANRIIIPHYNRDGSFYHFEARDLTDDPYRKYLYPFGWKDSIYNLPNINKEDDYFIFEGVIDSQFLENSVGARGVKKFQNVLDSVHRSLHSNAIMFPDGDGDGLRAGYNFLQKGFRVFKWTEEMLKYGKDLNNLVVKGFFKPEDFNKHGQVKKEVIMRHVIQPEIGEMLVYQIEMLAMGMFL